MVEEATQNIVGIEIQHKILEFVNCNHLAIRALRSYCQAIDGSRYKISLEEIQELKEQISLLSQDRLRYYDGALCQISDWTEIFQHQGQFLGEELPNGMSAVRGFYFRCILPNIRRHVECVQLDEGGSRSYFDTKLPEDQFKFIDRFAKRRRDELVFNHSPQLPPGYTAFIREKKLGRYIIEGVSSYPDPFLL